VADIVRGKRVEGYAKRRIIEGTIALRDYFTPISITIIYMPFYRFFHVAIHRDIHGKVI
jgi:hypothetical protein